jgi:hypothetical protein
MRRMIVESDLAPRKKDNTAAPIKSQIRGLLNWERKSRSPLAFLGGLIVFA